ncbi:MAG: TonB-dependent receptor [Bacteroidales bacterium]|nr:TonB-dependent receptor [Bacteroidales bacterium]
MVLKLFRKTLMLFLFLGISAMLLHAQVTIQGTAKDENNEPLPGVTVLEKGTNNGTTTDVFGKYSISVAENAVLMFSYVGYLTDEVAVKGTEDINVSMVPDIVAIGDVVVIGYGTMKKSDLTGAVASVKPDELTRLSTTNVQQSIQGRVAGVMVTSNSGAPGDDVTVRIRGISTVNNSNPLYVVDGFPMSGISYLNPSDVESMEVLKDASATAIYGNRGANGVVLITTKKGKEQKSVITFNAYYGLQRANKTIPLLNAMEYAESKYEAYDNNAEIKNRPRLALTGSGSALDDTLQWVLNNHYVGTDWQKEVLRTGQLQNYELSVTGGKEKYSYNVSGSYNRDDGIVINSWQKRYILRYGGQAEVNRFVRFEHSLAYRNVERINYDRDLYGQGVLPNALVGDPISPVYLPDTNWYAPVDISQTWNPVAAADRAKNNKFRSDEIVGNLGLDITIIKGLVFSSKVGADLVWNRNKRYIPVYRIGAKDLATQSSLDEIYQRTFAWNNSNYINFNRDFGKHSLNVMVGQEWSAFENSRLRYVVYDVPDNPSLYYPQFSPNTTDPQFNGDFSNTNRPAYETSLFSYFGRINYSFGSRYLVTLNARRDGSSKIAKENRWGTFPSFSLGWNIKNESFLKNVNAVSALKLRFGWGKTGNEGSLDDPYALFAVVTPNLDMVGPGDQALSGAIQTVNPNTNLKWEEVRQYNWAIDFGFFGGKLNGTIDVFLKKTSDMIIVLDPPYFAGSLASAGNYGMMENSGVEISLNYRNFDREFKYEIGGNFTWLKHPMITQWADPTLKGSVTKIQNVTRTIEGDEMAHFYGYETDGLLTQDDIDNTYGIDEEDGDTIFTYRSSSFWPGQIKLVDRNGDHVINALDKTNIGSANPDFYYGLNINLMYMGIDLVMFFQGVYGNELINAINAWSKFPDEGDNNLNREVLDAWTAENQNTSVPRLVQGNPIMQSYFNDYLVEDASYFRLKNIQLGYTLPQKITKFIGMSNLRFYISAENVFTITKYSGFDPEVGNIQYDNALQKNNPLAQGIDGANYPIAKKFLFGINVSF